MLEPSRESALFLHLVIGLQQSGMIALGKLVHPITHQLERDLDAARDTIDTLAALEQRTRGQLEPDEARLLRLALTELRMNYLDERKKSETAPAEGGAATAPEAPRT